VNRAAKARLQLRAVTLLRALKRSRTYEELAAETGLPAGDLNRYVNGHVLPGVERARAVVEGAGRETVVAELEERIRVDDEGYVDNSGVVFDQPFLNLVAPVVATAFDDPAPDAVLTAATDGITFGAAVASHLGARVAYAKKTRETAVEEFVEARDRLASGIELTYYLPTAALSAGDRVLVVDDLVRSGETQALLLDVAERSDAEVVGVAALIAVGDEGLSRARERTDAPVDALVRLR
jgi:adenine phosphoribosyltransferase